MRESWKNIPNTKGLYQASSLGRIKRNGKMLKFTINHKGYYRLELSVKGKPIYGTVHKFILLAFRGYPPPGYEALHKNSNKKDNRIDNLRWGTRSENIKQSYDEGRVSWFTKHPILAKRMRAKRRVLRGDEKINTIAWTSRDVLEAKKLKKSGLTYLEISKKFGVGLTTAYQAITGQRWKHLT